MSNMTSAEDFRRAANTVVPFGKYAGRMIDDIARTDQGLRYLDWLRGEREREERRLGNQTALTQALATYLDDPTIVRELAKAVEAGDQWATNRRRNYDRP